MALPCPRVPSDGGFADAIDLIFHKRESVSGGVCIGGLGEFGNLLVDHLVTSLLAIAIAAAIALPWRRAVQA